ncbi:MAG: glycosyltransferase family 1 protein [Chloroflexota bacterium]|nr:glycosyltransferase family 1 protein [Chloroflexota bacterium]
MENYRGYNPANETGLTARIGLNALLLSLSADYRGAGPNSYIFHLLRNLDGIGGEYRYKAFISDHRFATSGEMALYLTHWPAYGPAARVAWEQLILPVVLHRQRMDLIHGMAFVAPLLSPCPTVITVFDLSFLRFPDAFRRANRTYLRIFTPLSARHSKRVIAISQHTKRDVIRLLGVPAERVEVVYCGVDEDFYPRPAAEVREFRRKKELPERFMLFVGTLEPRKNVRRLIEAYAQTRDLGVRLVIAGGKGWLYEDIFATVEQLGLNDEVFFAGYVPAEELPLWYNAADLFVYPSLYEGFGLPPLEAMACGTPVISSNAASLPEIVGEAGLTVAPQDVDSLAAAMRQVLTDQNLHAQLRERGLQQARKFSWGKAARQTAEVYRQALRSY